MFSFPIKTNPFFISRSVPVGPFRSTSSGRCVRFRKNILTLLRWHLPTSQCHSASVWHYTSPPTSVEQWHRVNWTQQIVTVSYDNNCLLLTCAITAYQSKKLYVHNQQTHFHPPGSVYDLWPHFVAWPVTQLEISEARRPNYQSVWNGHRIRVILALILRCMV